MDDRRDRPRGIAKGLEPSLMLELQWSLWAAGISPDVPSYVPLSWETPPPTTNELLAAAAVRCEDVADRARELLDHTVREDANHLRVVAAVCLVTSDYIVTANERTPVAIAACALMLDRYCAATAELGLLVPASSATRALDAVLERMESTRL
jgi:hypothetical protein